MKAAGAVNLGGTAVGSGLAELWLLGRGAAVRAVVPMAAIVSAARMRTVSERKQEALVEGGVMVGLGRES